MMTNSKNRERQPHHSFPYMTTLVALLIPIATILYALLSAAGASNFLLWLTSPFNVFYESGVTPIISHSVSPLSTIILVSRQALTSYNYILTVAVFLLVELYSRYMADLKGSVSLFDHAFGMSIISSYFTAMVMWLWLGTPSSGTSILAFCMLLFFITETVDSELLKRLHERHNRKSYAAEIAAFASAAILGGASTAFFSYIRDNQYWYIHALGGTVFILVLSRYMGGVLFALMFYWYVQLRKLRAPLKRSNPFLLHR